jgi:hypothetical protein
LLSGRTRFAARYCKKMPGKKKRKLPDSMRSHSALLIASIFNVTPDYVRKVRRGDRWNDAINKAITVYEDGMTDIIAQIEKIAL